MHAVRTLCLPLLLLTAPAHATTLEQLFEQKQFAEFLPKAKTAAQQGDAEALFLLGKMHHLHLIKTPDAPDYDEAKEQRLAQTYYEQARSKGSARASHNLGLLLIDQGQKRKGIALLEEALARGPKMPTLLSLASAVSPGESPDLIDGNAIDDFGKSGDYYAAALALRPDDFSLENDAARQYQRAYLYYLRAADFTRANYDAAVLRQRAVLWLTKGMQRNEGIAWSNYGVLLLKEADLAVGSTGHPDYAAALTALKQGAQLNSATAHYLLAGMMEKGAGLAQPDPDSALQHYEAAARLGQKEAIWPAITLISNQLDGEEKDTERYRQGLARIKALEKLDSRHKPDKEPK